LIKKYTIKSTQPKTFDVIMPSADELQDEIDALNAQITKQGSLVRELKKQSSSNAEDIASAVEQLKKT